MKFSIVIPARDEEAVIGRGLDAIETAKRQHNSDVEIIVVINRCTDATERIARERGAKIIHDDSKILSAIRNAGARAATGDVLITIDADSIMSPHALGEVENALTSGRYVGGGVPIIPERWTLGIVAATLVLFAFIIPPGISAGMFWLYRRDFEAIGGFDENKVIAEDVDLAQRLRAWGKLRGLRYGTLWRAPIVTSCRKFDRFGDWFPLRMLLRDRRMLFDALQGKDRTLADKLFYDYKR